LRNFLLTKAGFDTVFELRGEAVRRSVIEDYMVNKFTMEGLLSHEDRLLFYYSGHGADKERRFGYLQFSKATAGDFSGDYVLPVRDFQQWSELNIAKHLLIILDACASGLAVQPKASPQSDALVRTMSGDSSGYLITAGTADQKAYQLEVATSRG